MLINQHLRLTTTSLFNTNNQVLSKLLLIKRLSYQSPLGLEFNNRDRPSSSNSRKPYQAKEYIYGYASISAALQAQHRKIYKLSVLSSAIKEEPTEPTTNLDNFPTLKPIRRKANRVEAEEKRSEIIELAKSHNIPIVPVKRHYLDKITLESPHQGMALEVEPLNTPNLIALSALDKNSNSYSLKLRGGSSLPGPLSQEKNSDKPKFPFWVVLDRIMDPHNLGAIIRTAYFLGAQGVIATIENSAGPTPTVSKTSAGALEIMGLHQVQGLASFLEKCKSNGWLILGTGFGTSSTSLEEVITNRVPLSSPTLLVLGNEGSGLTSSVKNHCDSLIEIAGANYDGNSGVGSLNVSVAAGILLHSLLIPHRK